MIAEQKRIEAEQKGTAPPQTLNDLRLGAQAPLKINEPVVDKKSLPPPPKPKPKPKLTQEQIAEGLRPNFYVGGKSKSEMFADLVKQEISAVNGDAESPQASPLYEFVLQDVVRQADLMDSSKKYVMMYKLRVTKSGVSWTIFRRFNQFFELDKKIRHHGLWPKESKLMPPKDAKRSRDDEALIQERKEKISRARFNFGCSAFCSLIWSYYERYVASILVEKRDSRLQLHLRLLRARANR